MNEGTERGIDVGGVQGPEAQGPAAVELLPKRMADPRGFELFDVQLGAWLRTPSPRPAASAPGDRGLSPGASGADASIGAPIEEIFG